MTSDGPIVVGYDAQPAGEQALDRAIAEARSSGRALVVVAVEELPLNPEGPQNFGTLDDSPARMIPLVAPADIEAALRAARERVEPSGVQADYVWTAGDPASGIVDVATDRGASLVVLGSHHHGFAARLLGTDVATEVKRRLGADLVVVE